VAGGLVGRDSTLAAAGNPMIEAVADNVRLLGNLQASAGEARKACIQLFYVPHRRSESGEGGMGLHYRDSELRRST
jgi:hypothetical protein